MTHQSETSSYDFQLDKIIVLLYNSQALEQIRVKEATPLGSTAEWKTAETGIENNLELESSLARRRRVSQDALQLHLTTKFISIWTDLCSPAAPNNGSNLYSNASLL